MAKEQEIIQPAEWAKPRGYANGVVARGRTLFVGGQIGWDARSETARLPASFAEQFDAALGNVLEVVRAAGGKPEDVVRCTVYVTSREEYVAAAKDLGQAWRRRMGKHYPAMALLVVAGLLEPAAKVEIEATAVLD